MALRSFDKLNRVLSQTFSSSPGENIAYSYDATDGGNFGIGRLTGFSDETGGTSLVYNERGDVVRVTNTIGGNSYKTAYAYDPADHVTSVTYPSGHVFDYGRDSLGRINAVTYRPSNTAAPIPLASDVSYLPFGPVAGFVYGNGLVRTHGFDLDYRLDSISTASGTTSLQDLRLGYDAVNNINAITNLLNASQSQWFNYDENYRLTNAVGHYGTLGYGYDPVGNRLVEVSNGVTNRYTYSATANRLEGVSGGNSREFTYTAAGNTETDNRGVAGIYGYGYGARNRLNTLTLNGNTIATYAYNAFGQRLVKTVGAATTHFHYDQQSHLIAETDGQTGAMLREYVWLGDMPLAMIEGDGTVYFIHCDHLNTPQDMTDGSGTVVWDRAQKPFGETTAIITSAATPKLSVSGFNGEGQFQATVNGIAGTIYVFQRSTDLNGTGWVSIATNTASFTFADAPNANAQTRFYRVVATSSAGGTEVRMNLRFPGQYFDAESDMNYNLTRDYSSSIGRYIESDIIGLQGGINVFIYGNDNAVHNTDSTGLFMQGVAIGVVGMIGFYEFIYKPWYYAHDDSLMNLGGSKPDGLPLPPPTSCNANNPYGRYWPRGTTFMDSDHGQYHSTPHPELPEPPEWEEPIEFKY